MLGLLQFVMKCTSHGHPIPQVTWNRIDENWKGIEIQDGGIYDIKVTSDEESREVTAVLTVSELIDPIEGSEGFECRANNGFDESAIWYWVDPV